MSETVVSMSGGKDSTALALMMLERGETVDEFVFCDTGYEFPECYAALERFERDTGRIITRLRTEHTLEWWMCDKPVKHHNPDKTRRDGLPRRNNGYGWPSPLKRWCTSVLKTELIMRHVRGRDAVQCIGIAADEPKRVRPDAHKRYPLVEYGITEAQCLEYCRSLGYYPSPCAYDECRRMSCYICPLQNLKQIEYIVTQRPELWAEIKRLEARLGEPWKTLEGRGTEYFEKRFSMPLFDEVEVGK